MGALGHWLVVQPHRNAQCFIHAAHVIFRNAPGALPQAAFIQCANLFGQHNAVFGQAAAVGPHADMGGQAVFILPAGDGGSDHGIVAQRTMKHKKEKTGFDFLKNPMYNAVSYN